MGKCPIRLAVAGLLRREMTFGVSVEALRGPITPSQLLLGGGGNYCVLGLRPGGGGKGRQGEHSAVRLLWEWSREEKRLHSISYPCRAP